MNDVRAGSFQRLVRNFYIPAMLIVAVLEIYQGGGLERFLYAALAAAFLSPIALQIWMLALVLRIGLVPYLPDDAASWISGMGFQYVRLVFVLATIATGRWYADHFIARCAANSIARTRYFCSALCAVFGVAMVAIGLFWPVADSNLTYFAAAVCFVALYRVLTLPRPVESATTVSATVAGPFGASGFAGLFLLSISTLLLEVLHTRILSFMLFPSLVYIVVSFAMLGFGVSGAALSIYPPSRWARPRERVASLAIAFAITAVAGLAILGQFPISAFSFMRHPESLLLLIAYYFVFTIPYYFVGQCLGGLFTLYPKQITKLYFINLVGSGLGCLLLVLLIRPFGGQGTLIIAALLALASAFAFALHHSKRASATAGALAVICLIFLGIGAEKVIPIKVDPDKELGQVIDSRTGKDGELEMTAWSAISRTDIARFANDDWFVNTVHLLGVPWESKMVATDGGAYTPMLKAVPNSIMEDARENKYVMSGFRMLGYLTVENPDTLIIGCGGGSDVIAAKLRNAKKITAVDLNPITIHAMKNEFLNYTGGLYTDPAIEVHAAEGRSFVARSGRKYTNIHMNGVDTLNALAAGANVTAENYLYTTEAMIDYLNHLENDGFLTIARLSFDPPRETIKLCTAMIDAFERMELGNPADHIMIIGDTWSEWTTFVCKKSPLTPQDMAKYEEAFSLDLFRIYYRPGMEPGYVFPENAKRGEQFVEVFDAYANGTLDKFFAAYPYDIRPATDDRPYFFKIHKAESFLKPMETSTAYEKNFGIIALIILLIQTILVSAVLIVMPLLQFHREGLRVPHKFKFIVYFSGLGLGFMLVELSLMQKLSLMMGHPTYSIAVVLTSLLIFCGMGSLVSGSLRLGPRTIIAVAVTGISIGVMLYMPLLPWVTESTIAWPLFVRALVAMALLAPVSFCMGMPFPTGLRIVSEVHVRFVPWAWGANGVASVLGTVLCILLSMSYGFNVVLALAIIVYVLAGICIGLSRSESAPVQIPVVVAAESSEATA
jgi:hypothetical protein